MLSFSSKWQRRLSRRDYAPLPGETGSEDTLDSTKLDSLDGKGHQSPEPSSKSPWSPALVATILLALLNLVLVVYVWAYPTSFPPSTAFFPTHRLTHDDLERLRRPSQFVHLENVRATSQLPPQTFKNWPLLLVPIDSDNPHTTLGDDPKPVGMRTPGDRAFRISGTISTVAQFRAIDYMMEFCQLVIKPPPGTVNGTSSIEIYQLDLALPLKARDLTFSNRPTCNTQRISGAQVFNGSHFQHNFNCPRDQLLSFEVRCGKGSGCNLDWWQMNGHYDYGMFMLQSSVAIAV